MEMDRGRGSGVPHSGRGGGLAHTVFALGLALRACRASGNPGSTEGGLTVTHFGNTAMAGPGRPTVAQSLENVPTETAATSGPSSLTVTGRVAPPAEGNYGFELSFDPPLVFPSDEAYGRLWVNDVMLYPRNSRNQSTR